jgi:hypothetical protein
MTLQKYYFLNFDIWDSAVTHKCHGLSATRKNEWSESVSPTFPIEPIASNWHQQHQHSSFCLSRVDETERSAALKRRERERRERERVVLDCSIQSHNGAAEVLLLPLRDFCGGPPPPRRLLITLVHGLSTTKNSASTSSCVCKNNNIITSYFVVVNNNDYCSIHE